MGKPEPPAMATLTVLTNVARNANLAHNVVKE